MELINCQTPEFAYNVPGPVYVRLGMNKEKEFFGEEYKIRAGGFEIIPSLTVAKESRAHKRRNYTIYELLFSF